MRGVAAATLVLLGGCATGNTDGAPKTDGATTVETPSATPSQSPTKHKCKEVPAETGHGKYGSVAHIQKVTNPALRGLVTVTLEGKGVTVGNSYTIGKTPSDRILKPLVKQLADELSYESSDAGLYDGGLHLQGAGDNVTCTVDQQ